MKNSFGFEENSLIVLDNDCVHPETDETIEEKAQHLLAIVIAEWLASDVSGDLSGYDRAVDNLAMLRGGPTVGRCQMLALFHRRLEVGGALDAEEGRDRRLLVAALDALGAP